MSNNSAGTPVAGEEQYLVKIEADDVIWGIETEENRMVGLTSDSVVSLFVFCMLACTSVHGG
jgi:hypothetical protein